MGIEHLGGEEQLGLKKFAHAEDPVNPGGELDDPTKFDDPNKPTKLPENTQNNPEGQDDKESSQTRFRQSIIDREKSQRYYDINEANLLLNNFELGGLSGGSGGKSAGVSPSETSTANA